MNKKVLKTLSMALAVSTIFMAGCSKEAVKTTKAQETTNSQKTAEINKETGLEIVETEKNEYSKAFSIIRLKDGYTMLEVLEDRYLLVPEGKEEIKGLDIKIKQIKMPLNKIVILDPTDMAFVSAIGAHDKVVAVNKNEKDLKIKKFNEMLKDNKIKFIGSGENINYDDIATLSPNFAFMVGRNISYYGKISSKFDELGIPYMDTRLAVEKDPRARVEWMKLFGALLGKDEEAKKWVKAEIEKINIAENKSKDFKDKKKVAFFRVSNKGISVRTSDDYGMKAIKLAGGVDPFEGKVNAEKGTQIISVEEFYKLAQDIDILIHENMAGYMRSKDDMTKLAPVLKDLKAFKNDAVWTTTTDYWQKADTIADQITEINDMISNTSMKKDYNSYLHAK